MNVYDFDGTIYYPDCVLSFGMWCAIKHPRLWFTFLPKAFFYLTLYILGIMPRYRFERKGFGFLGMVDDLDEQLEKFWDKHEKRISKWYLAQKKPDDLIISASPECIIAPIAKRLGVSYVATEYDREYGVLLNNLMYAKEKARYIFDRGFPVINEFYSDSLSDTPIALCAEKAFYVTHRAQKVSDWPELDRKTLDRVHSKIDTGTDIHLD